MKIKKLLIGCGAIFATLGLISCSTTTGSDTIVEETRYTVTYDYKNGDPSTSIQIQENQKIVKPANPIKENFIFKGWYEDEDYQKEWNFEENVVTKNITLYARWEKVIQYSIGYNMHGHGTAPTGIAEATTLPNPLPSVADVEDWHFVGWYLDSNYTTPAEAGKVLTESVTLHAKWEDVSTPTPPTPEKYSVSYNMHGHGTAPTSIAEATTLPNPLPSVADVEDWHFVGWYLDSNYATPAEAGKVLTENVTLHAKWEDVGTPIPPTPEKYSVSYNMHGHGTAPTSIAEATTLPNPLPSVADEEDWHFVGWYLDSNYVTPAEAGKVLTENVTLHAKWEDVSTPTPPTSEKYSVSYNMHGHGTAPTGIAEATKLPNPLPSVADEEDWHFVGWYLDSNYVTPAEAGKVLTENVTLHAKWEDVSTPTPPTPEKYSVSYNMHGHGTAPTSIAEATTLPTPLPSVADVEDWHFVGWYLDSNYTTPAEAGKVLTENVTLHAKWEDVSTPTPPTPEKYSVSFNTNGKGEQPNNIAQATELPNPLPVLTDANFVFAGWYLDETFKNKATPGMILTEDVTLYAKWVNQDTFVLTKAEGYLEGAYLEWKVFADCTEYNVYYKKFDDGDSAYIKIDQQLIREYPDKYRADILGLAAGKYTVKAIPVRDNQELGEGAIETVVVEAHVRSGYGFVNGTSSGAYNENGTLKANAKVIYITQTTKDTVQMDLGGVTQKGLQNILNGYKKGGSTPLCVRLIGNITDFSFMEKGDILIDGLTQGVTIEGVGEDATANGWGLRIKGSSNVEVRNLGFMNCDSGEGDNVGLQQDNDHIWVHNCDFFYGNAGSDKDQVKGDGALDTKTSTYVTHSYNHFWDNGKTNLQGMKSEKEENYITYHHNWYDHSDSRHPRIRTCTVHVYNNYFDGNAKYGVGVTMGSSTFVENNYFRNCNNPMLSSGQGTDALGEGTFSGETGGIIKAYGNYIEGGKPVIYYQDNTTSFDAYKASTRNEKIASTIKTLSGGTSYNNFDTESGFYQYEVDSPEVARQKVMKYAGRVNGGDLKWEFNNLIEDTNYLVIQGLKDTLINYKSKLVRVLGVEGTQGGGQTPGGGEETPDTPPAITDSITHNFTTDGKESSVFTITGNLATNKGEVTYKGLTLTQCLKLESATNISFSTSDTMTLILVFVEQSGTIKVDGTKRIANNGIITISLSAGTHTLTKADTANLFYIELGKTA